jgi:hypothetical protein
MEFMIMVFEPAPSEWDGADETRGDVHGMGLPSPVRENPGTDNRPWSQRPVDLTFSVDFR